MNKGSVHIIFRKLFYLFMLAAPAALYCQETKVSSLRPLIVPANSDTTVINTLKERGIEHMESDPATAIAYGLQALKLSRHGGYPTLEAECLQLIGVAYDYKGQLDSCLHYLNQSIYLYRQLNDAEGVSNLLNDIGAAYHFRGNLELALKNYLTALESKRKSGDLRRMAPIINNIGLIYRAKKDYATAIKFFRESAQIKIAQNDEKGLVNTYMNLGSLYFSLSHYDSALWYARTCARLAESLGLMQDVAGAQSNIGRALLKMNKFQESEVISRQALDLAEKTACRNCLLTIYENLGDIELQKKRFAKAREYYLKGLQLARETERQEQLMQFYNGLAVLAYQSKDFRSALMFKDSAEELSEKMLNEENIRQINELNMVYQTAEKEREILLLNAQKDKNQLLLLRSHRERNYFLFSSILLMALAIISYLAFSANRKKNKLLRRQKETISSSLAEKEILLKEIHHRVKNNLQLVSSLLSLQAGYIKDEQALDAVKESRNRVYSMAILHQNLYQDDHLTGIEIADYINNLCGNLLDSYTKNNIQIEQDIPRIWMDVELVIPIGLILNELITNSLKYAFPQGKSGKISISVKEIGEQLLIVVSDDGRGLDENFDLSAQPTFGFKMINAFIQKMNGQFTVYNDHGTKAELRFNHLKYRFNGRPESADNRG